MSTTTRFAPPHQIVRLPLLRSTGEDGNDSEISTRIQLTDELRDQFRLKVPLLAIKIKAEQISNVKSNPLTRSAILASKGLPSVRIDPLSTDQSHKLLLLNSSQIDQLPTSALDYFKQSGLEFRPFELQLDWNYFQAEEIIERLLPEELLSEVPSSFTIIGHIAHFNLRKEYLPYRHLIGQIILEKNSAIRTVVNKLDSINSTFRFFQIDLMAGEPDYQVSLSQASCRFEFDFSKVYYNPRLSTEHAKLVSTFLNPREVLLDAFAGVGPFAIQAARNHSCFVIASDLNPSAVEALKRNVTLNRLSSRVRVFSGDARDRIRDGVMNVWQNPFVEPPPPPTRRSSSIKEIKVIVEKPKPEPSRLVSHFVMNLPELALNFLDAYIGLYTPLLKEFGQDFKTVVDNSPLPMVHCYCFSKAEEGEEAERDICDRATLALGYKVHSSISRFELAHVRKVAPHKDMYRLSFELPREVLFCKSIDSVKGRC
ncbi:hypothetical protein CROQUDRAFT_86295 [Cronartium quercuum f. sp. fusiforme G11]|uniref:tRNA (guanine(37)-N1)-methyltransferase n=1 Tax=Cronartium quercuum f. sp. fusiforme G11 TaxID=708437 RepID=A0A9P6NTH5_9BASI|nr:hypothetical protein CROQUDRAFT_86295 [Cronartium quercuum f. sp. fusiforme G11]